MLDVSLVGSNVLVILVDALRADSLAAYGHPRPTSPFVDELAEHAVIFEKASSASAHTGPSVLPIFTGLYPHRHGLQWSSRTMGSHPRQGPVRPAVSETLALMAEHFARLGYRTGAVVANPESAAAARPSRGAAPCGWSSPPLRLAGRDAVTTSPQWFQPPMWSRRGERCVFDHAAGNIALSILCHVSGRWRRDPRGVIGGLG